MGFDEFVTGRGERLLRAAWLLTGDRHRAEDLVQTALTKCYARYDGDDDRYEAYVRTTMYRTYVSWWRRRSWHELPVERLPETGSGDDAREVRVDVARALWTLNRVQRAAVTLRYFDDLSVSQVAEALGIPLGTAKSHIHRGLTALRECGLIEEETIP